MVVSKGRGSLYICTSVPCGLLQVHVWMSIVKPHRASSYRAVWFEKQTLPAVGAAPTGACPDWSQPGKATLHLWVPGLRVSIMSPAASLKRYHRAFETFPVRKRCASPSLVVLVNPRVTWRLKLVSRTTSLPLGSGQDAWQATGAPGGGGDGGGGEGGGGDGGGGGGGDALDDLLYKFEAAHHHRQRRREMER